MLIQTSVTAELTQLIDAVGDDADAGLKAILDQIATLPMDEQREAMHDLLPSLGSMYAGAVSEASTVFFDSLMEIQEVRAPVATDIVPEPDVGRWHSLAGWSMRDSIFERGGMALIYSMLSGGLTRILSEVSADTMIGNAEIQTERMRAQRVPSAGCCAFCGMLASRFAGYTSERSAGKVVGRGQPVESTIRGYRANGTAIRKSGGQARGVRERGSRSLGEDFHDDCRCKIVIVTEANEVQLRADADRYYDAYRDAADKINSGLTLTKVQTKESDGTLHNQYTWVHDQAGATTPKSRTNMIVNSMRRDLDVS